MSFAKYVLPTYLLWRMSKRFICAIIIYLYLTLLSHISGMDSSSRWGKSSPRGRGRGCRSSAVDPTVMDIDPSSPQVPHVLVQPGTTMAAYILGILGPMPPPFGAFHHQTSYIPNQRTMYGQFAITFLQTPILFTLCSLLPNPLTLAQTSPKTTLQVVKVKHNLVMGALKLRLGLSQMATDKSSFVISCEVLHEFCITSNQFDVLCSIRFFPNDGAVSRISFIFQSKFNRAWPSWSKVPKLVRDLWFGEFKVTTVTTY